MTEQQVLRVDSVDIHLPVSPRPNLVVVARGVTTTTGWTHGHLEQRNQDKPPHDGVYEFDFVAQPPSGPAGELITPIAGAGVITRLYRNMRAVRVYAKSNSKDRLITALLARTLDGPAFSFDGTAGLGWRSVPFTTVVQSSFGGPSGPARKTLGAAEYSAWFGGHPPAQPPVDFTKDTVLAVGMGTEPTSGYRVEITSIVQMTDGITAPYCFVHYVEHHPGPNDIVADIITAPQHVVVCEATGPFVFVAGRSAALGGRSAMSEGGGGQPDPLRGGSGGGGVGNG